MGVRQIDRDVLAQYTTEQSAGRLAGTGDQTVLRARAALLPADDRTLLELVLSQRHTLRELARMAGVNPGSLSRRVNRLIERLRSKTVATLARFGSELPEDYRRIAIARFAEGRSVCWLVRRLGWSRQEVADCLGYLRAWVSLRGGVSAEVEDRL